MMASIGEDITQRLIERAGIKPGMKILDLGCGKGDVTYLLSNYIGANGIVVGIDSNESAIAHAKNKAKELGMSNVHFYLGDITQDFKFEHSDFDAIIVRRVLMYLLNPENTIAIALKYLKGGAIFLAQENDISLTPIGLDLMPKHKKIIDLIKKTLEKEKINLYMGFELNAILTRSGLKVGNIWAEAVLSTPDQQTPWAFLAESMKDRMLNQSVINNVTELALETLSDELYAERIQNSTTFVSDLVFCAVAKK